MFSTELGFTLEAAFREASSRRHAYFTLEHLLYALIFEDSVQKILHACGVETNQLKKQLEQFFDEEIEELKDDEAEPQQTPSVQRVLQRAVYTMHSSNRKVVSPKDVLVALLDEQDTHALFFLQLHNLSKIDVLDYIAHGVSKNEFDPHLSGIIDDEFDSELQEDQSEAPKLSRSTALSRFTENLTQKAQDDELDPVIGRKEEIQKILRVLARRTKNNPLLLGDPGVGKTAVCNGVVQILNSEDAPEILKNSQVWSLSIGSLIAGTKFRGELEERLRTVLDALKKNENSILVIDEIHTVVGAGSTGAGSLDAASLLKPALAQGWLRCIGITTHEDYKKKILKDKAFERRFSKIDIPELTQKDCIEVLKGLKSRYEDHHDVKFTLSAIESAVELTAKYIPERRLPDKAIDIIDEAGAKNALLPKAKRNAKINTKEIEKIVSIVAKVPVVTANKNEAESLKNIESNLENIVFGQKHAIKSVSRAIKRSRASLGADDKPIGSFLFAGPTGVGKTELVKALSKELGVTFIRFDMSEYMEKHSVARLIGAPPGYIGHDEGGLLVDKVRRDPHAIILFDEIEKAHPDVHQVLLQVLDDASLTDSQGKKADFRSTVIVMTTNAGSEKSSSIGFGESTTRSLKSDAIKKLFKPELRNRLDDIVYFNPLPKEIISKITQKFIEELRLKLAPKNIKLTFSEDAFRIISEKGFDPLLGARPMRRYIEKNISDQIADKILFTSLGKDGGEIKIDVNIKETETSNSLSDNSADNAKVKAPDTENFSEDKFTFTVVS